ncbi:MAG: tetratricopeptide repeat protein [Terriglobales bacterium]
MTKLRCFSATVLLCLVPLGLALADEGHEHGPASGKLGTVKFPTSCDKSVQNDFERAVAMLHSFWYDEAEKAFSAIAAKDRECAMAYWGIAMSLHHPLWAPASAAVLEKGSAAVAKARAAKKQTARERGYVEAIARVYEGDATRSFADRNKAWAVAMEEVHRANPNDREAEIYYLLALRSTAPNTDKTYAIQRKVGPRLEKLFAEQSNHPGLAHYIIHTYDYPELAAQGLHAARKYAKIAPESPHALHMPSHIFVRVGMWPDAIASNIDSAEAGRASAAKTGSAAAVSEQLHAMDYLVYAYLQRGEQAQARKIWDELKNIQADTTIFSAGYAAAAIPARCTIETRRWAEARDLPELKLTGGSYWTEVANGIVYWARAVGAARSGDLDAARANGAQLEAIRDALLRSKKQDGADTVEIMRLQAAGWTAFAAGQKDEALRLMRAAADLEDRTDKHPVTPGPVLPAREQLGDLLVELKRPDEALTEYKASLRTSPNRFNGLLGAARAAEMAGNSVEAKQLYAQLRQVAPNAGPELLRKEREYAVVSE